MELKLPEERLFELGFEVLDYIYGELTKRRGVFWDKAFVDGYGVIRLGYDEASEEKVSLLGYFYKDKDFFLSILPVSANDFERVLKYWILKRHKLWAHKAGIVSYFD